MSQEVGKQDGSKKRKIARMAADREAAAAGAAVAPKLPRTKKEANEGRRVIVVLERACLETVKTKKGYYELLNCDDHKHLHSKFKKDPSKSRPDIAHQALLALLDSPLNKAGLLQVYVHTEANVLVEVHPTIRIPRTLKRFSGLIVQLLHKHKIRAMDSSQTLMKVIRNPVMGHLPVGCRKFATSCRGKLVDVYDLVQSLPQDEPVVFGIGAMAHGSIDDHTKDYAEELLSFSQYPLSAACAISRLMGAFEKHWGIH